ncbi:MAG: MFS transporter [Candidatus Thorarchaeota archaeon]|nr:MFS transporter [Candidatus Thorarchaeota archaeon]
MNQSENLDGQNDTWMPGPYRVVGATSFGVFLSGLDASIVNVSLVTMMMSFGVTIDAIQWVVVAYLLVLTSSMPLMGKFGDRYGKKTIFQLGMLVFIAGSFFCAISVGLEMLVIARVFQALGSAMIAANGLALVTYFTTPQNRGRAIGLNSVVLAAALGSGPVLGGVLTQLFGWESIFLVNLPIGIIGFITVQYAIPKTELVYETRFDTIGAGLFFTFLFLIIYYVTVATSTNGLMIFLFIGGALLAFIGFILRERSFESPVIAIDVLADRKISVSIFSALLAYMAIVPISFLLPFYLQEAIGFDQFMTGIFLIIQPVMISVTGPIAGFVSERVNANIQTTVGLVIELAGLLLITLVVPNVLLMGVGVAIMGTGLSFFSVANGNFIMTAAPKKYMGVVSALTNLARTTGFSVATALVTTVFGVFFFTFNPWGIGSGTIYFESYNRAFQSSVFIFSFLAIIAAIISTLRGLNQAEEDRENELASKESILQTELISNE